MVLHLFSKDALRLSRNPWPTLIFLAIPLLLTGLLGIVFGPKSSAGGLQPIPLAVVDEDGSLLSEFLLGAAGQRQAQGFLEPRFVDRAEAERLLNDNEISAMLVIPKAFTIELLKGHSPPPLELVKNPAQSFHPAIVEELVGVVAEALSGLTSVFRPELPRWEAFFEEAEHRDTFDYQGLARLIERAGDRVLSVRSFLSPPLVGYGEETRATEQTGANGSAVQIPVYVYILPGMSALFLLLIGDGATRDLYKELRLHTLARYRTFHSGLWPLVLAKLLYAVLIMFCGALILFAAGHWLFGIVWRNGLWLALLTFAFCLCGAGLMSALAALARVEKRADALNSLLVFGMSFLGGSMVPVNTMPAFIRNLLSPLTPNYWFIESVRRLQEGSALPMLTVVVPSLASVGLLLTALAAWRFNVVLQRGERP